MSAFARIRPDGSRPRKYSMNLYKRLTKAPWQRIYLADWEPIRGQRTINAKALKEGNREQVRMLYVGHTPDNWLCGNRLVQIANDGNRVIHVSYAYAGVTAVCDVTDWFMREYERKGLCLIYSGAHHWVQINRNARKCAFCGLHQHRSVSTVRVTERVERWAEVR